MRFASTCASSRIPEILTRPHSHSGSHMTQPPCTSECPAHRRSPPKLEIVRLGPINNYSLSRATPCDTQPGVTSGTHGTAHLPETDSDSDDTPCTLPCISSINLQPSRPLAPFHYFFGFSGARTGTFIGASTSAVTSSCRGARLSLDVAPCLRPRFTPRRGAWSVYRAPSRTIPGLLKTLLSTRTHA